MKKLAALFCASAMVLETACVAFAASGDGQMSNLLNDVYFLMPEDPVAETGLEEGEAFLVQNAATNVYENAVVAQVVSDFNYVKRMDAIDKMLNGYDLLVPETVEVLAEGKEVSASEANTDSYEYKALGDAVSEFNQSKMDYTLESFLEKLGTGQDGLVSSSGAEIDAKQYHALVPFMDLAVAESETEATEASSAEAASAEDVQAAAAVITVTVSVTKNMNKDDMVLVTVNPESGEVAFAEVSGYDAETGAVTAEVSSACVFTVMTKENLISIASETNKGNKIDLEDYASVTPFVDLVIKNQDGTTTYETEEPVIATLKSDALKGMPEGSLIIMLADPATGAVEFIEPEAYNAETGEVTGEFSHLGAATVIYNLAAEIVTVVTEGTIAPVDGAPSIGDLIPEAPYVVSGNIKSGQTLAVQNTAIDYYAKSRISDLVVYFNNDKNAVTVPNLLNDVVYLFDSEPVAVSGLKEGTKLLVENVDTEGYENEDLAAIVASFARESVSAPVSLLLENDVITVAEGTAVDPTEYEAIMPFIDLTMKDSAGEAYDAEQPITAELAPSITAGLAQEDLMVMMLNPESAELTFVEVKEFDSETGEMTVDFPAVGPFTIVTRGEAPKKEGYTNKDNVINPMEYEALMPFVDMVLKEENAISYDINGEIVAGITLEAAKELDQEDLLIVMMNQRTGETDFIEVDEYDPEKGSIIATYPHLGPFMVAVKTAAAEE